MFKQLFNNLKDNVAAALPIAQLANAPLDKILLTIDGNSLKARHYRSYIVALIIKGRISRFIGPKKNLEIYNGVKDAFQKNPTKTLTSLVKMEQQIQSHLDNDTTLQQYYLGHSIKNALIAQAIVSQIDVSNNGDSTSGLSNQDVIDNCMPPTDYV